MKVYLDAGHGGSDSGAVGVGGVLEKNICLDVCNRIGAILKQRGIEIKASRSSDITKSLSERTNEANKWGANAFISIHCNSASNASAKGLETFCYKFKYRKLADCVQDELLNDKLYTINRGVKEGNWHVIRESNMPACLVELGFISNKEDCEFVQVKLQEMSLAIADGICNFLGVKVTTPPPMQKEKVYNIVTGGFGSKDNAQKKLDHLYGVTNWYLRLEESSPGDWRIRTGGFTGEARVKREMEALREVTGWWCDYILE